VDEDLDDTVVAAPRTIRPGEPLADLDDTIIRRRDPVSAPAPDVVHPPPSPVVDDRGGIHSFSLGGTVHRLDAPVIIGRNPRGPRVPTGEVIHLVTVASASSEVSSSHVEIRQRGSSVIVTDLRSTNGSSVTIPLSQPRRLRQGESVVVSPGSLVDIGDGNIIQILPLIADSAGRQS